MAKATKEKVCFQYEQDGETKRTRFFKPTSTHVLKKHEELLNSKGLEPERVTRTKWVARHGRINKPKLPPSAHQNIAMLGKTEQMREEEYKRRLERKKRYENRNKG